MSASWKPETLRADLAPLAECVLQALATIEQSDPNWPISNHRHPIRRSAGGGRLRGGFSLGERAEDEVQDRVDDGHGDEAREEGEEAHIPRAWKSFYLRGRAGDAGDLRFVADGGGRGVKVRAFERGGLRLAGGVEVLDAVKLHGLRAGFRFKRGIFIGGTRTGVRQTNLDGAIAYCIKVRSEYNAQARKFTQTEWRSTDLPYQIDASAPETDCKPTDTETK